MKLISSYLVIILAVLCLPKDTHAQVGPARESWSIQIDGRDITPEQFLSTYLQFESITGQEKNAGQYLKSVCEQNGLYINQLGEEEGNFNFAASLFPLSKNKPNILFLNHIDVVPPGSLSGWAHPPFEGEIADDEIWGRGAVDMKGIAAAQLFGLLNFKSELKGLEIDFNVTFLAVSSEEVISEKGAAFVVENYLDLLNPSVVFCEGPTGLKGIIRQNAEQEVFGISVVDKNPVWIKMQMENNSFVHGASSPEHYPAKDLTLALNRLLSSSQPIIFTDTNIGMLKGIGKFEKGLTGLALRYPRFFKPLIAMQIRKDAQMRIFFSNTITLVDFQAGSHSANTISPGAKCQLDCRLMPGQDIEGFIESIKNKINNPDIEFTVSSSLPGTGVSPSEENYYRIFEMAIKKSYPSAAVVPVILPGYTDCIHFRNKGIPSYGSNPMLISEEILSTIHNYNERLPTDALYAGILVYYDFLAGILEYKSGH